MLSPHPILQLVASGDFQPAFNPPDPQRYRLLAAAAAVLGGGRVLDLCPDELSAALLTGRADALYAPVYADAARAAGGPPPFAAYADYRPVVAATPEELPQALAPLYREGPFDLAYVGPGRGGAWAAAALSACRRLLGRPGCVLVSRALSDPCAKEAATDFLFNGYAEHLYLVTYGDGLVVARPGPAGRDPWAPL
jgi:hypothetical protein